ncbi:MAG: hypothetical protein KAI72_09645, partial [Candidatus Pacebacteria bacterium]|nr:hypothetical protein [Candidatus Paceibacterota bacterium]
TAVGGTATFASPNVGTHIVSATGINLTGDDAINYSYNGTATGNATIIAKEITITPNDSQTKVYGESDPTFDYTNTDLIGNDEFTSGTSLSRVVNENVGNYDYTLGTLDAGTNYTLILSTVTSLETFEITVKSLTVNATTDSKIYDGNIIAYITFDTLALNGVVGSENVILVSTGYIATFASADVGSENPVTVSGLTLGGIANLSNYLLIQPILNDGVIGAKTITATITANDKNYDGDAVAEITGCTLVDTVSDDSVTAVGGTATFASPNVGTHVVSAIDITLDGTDAGNYSYDGTAVGEADIIAKEIAVAPTAGQKKEFGASDPLPFTYMPTPSLIGSDVFTGLLERVSGETVDTYAINQGTLSAGGNYNITYTAGTFTIEDTTASDEPNNVSATAVVDGNIEVSFNDVNDAGSGVSTYSIKRSTVAGDSYTEVGTVTDNESASYTYTDTGLTDGTTYYYVVTAIDGSSNESDLSVEVSATSDSTDPTVNITSTVFPLTNTSPIPVTIIFSETVTDLTLSEISITNGTGALTGSGANYDLAVTPAGQGVVTVNIAADVVLDLAGNYNKVAQEFTINYDSQVPSITDLSVSPNSDTSIVGNTITLTITADEIGYTADDITVNGIDVASSFVDNNDKTYTAIYLVAENDSDIASGAITASVVLEDEAGNKNTAYTNVNSNTLAIDANTPVINSVTSNATGSGWLKVGDTIIFTVDINTAENNLTITPATYNGVNLTWTTADNGDTFTATYTVEEGQSDQTSTLQLTGVQATDPAGNISIAVDGTDVAKTIDANIPEITLLST